MFSPPLSIKFLCKIVISFFNMRSIFLTCYTVKCLNMTSFSRSPFWAYYGVTRMTFNTIKIGLGNYPISVAAHFHNTGSPTGELSSILLRGNNVLRYSVAHVKLLSKW